MIPSNDITNSDGKNTSKVYKSTMDAITTGTAQGSNIAVSVGTILIAVIILVLLYSKKNSKEFFYPLVFLLIIFLTIIILAFIGY